MTVALVSCAFERPFLSVVSRQGVVQPMVICWRRNVHQHEDDSPSEGKRGVFRCFVPPVVMRKLGQREVVGPVGLLMVSEKSKVRFHPLVVSLGLSVGPGVVGGGDVLLNPQSVT